MSSTDSFVTLHSASETFGESLLVESLRSRLAKTEAGLCLNYKPAMLRETFKQLIALLLFRDNRFWVSPRLNECLVLFGPDLFAFIT
jgi:hypothetical protein